MFLIKKFISKGIEKDDVKHWEVCEKYKVPFISVSNKGEDTVEVFYDITNIVGTDKLEYISEKLKAFYINYIEFLGLDIPSIQHYLDEHYFFKFELKREYHQVLTEKLYDFLIREIDA